MAIVYSYPKVTSPLATDVLVLTDTTVTAGKRKNKTKSIAMSDVATYIINSKSGITGTGTLNTFPIFTASTIIGDSIITQAALGQGITVGGNLDVTNDTNLQGSLLADSLEVTNDSVFIGSARFNGTIKDTSGGVGTNGQVLTSTGTGVAWATDAGGSVTGTGTTNYIAKWNTSSSIQDSIIFDNGTNVGIGTATPSAKLHVNGSEFLVTQGNETGLNINNDTYIYKIGDISGGENQAYMQIDSAASKAFFLNSNVGIGTTSPSEKLEVLGYAKATTGFKAGNYTVLNESGNETSLSNSAYYPMFFKTNNSIRMTISNAGNVGIGNTNPSDNLEIGTNGGADTAFRMYSDQINKYFRINSGGNFTQLRTTGDQNLILDSQGAAGYVTFQAGNSEKMRINYNGNVGIGTTSPSQKLDVAGNITIQSGGSSADSNYISMVGSRAIFGYDGSISSAYMRSSDTSKPLVFGSGSSEFMRIVSSSGNVGIGTTSPSQKLEISEGYISSSGAGTVHGFELKRSGLDTYRLRHLDSGLTVFNDTDGRKEMTFDGTGNVGVGTSTPASKLTVTGGDAEVTGSDKGLILESPNGTRYRIQVDNSGNLTTTAV